jgi:hypothetical protein
MRLSSVVRLATAICGTVLLCALPSAVAEAAPAHARAVSHKSCGTRAAGCRVKARQPKSLKPTPYFVRAQRLVHRSHPGSWLERSRPDPLRYNDEAALQDRTVVSGEDDLLLASLEPLGVLVSPHFAVAFSAVVPRHSPRGPPSFPGSL